MASIIFIMKIVDIMVWEYDFGDDACMWILVGWLVLAIGVVVLSFLDSS